MGKAIQCRGLSNNVNGCFAFIAAGAGLLWYIVTEVKVSGFSQVLESSGLLIGGPSV